MGKQLKKLVVYYSLEGNTKFIAESIAKAAGADVLELKMEKGIKPGNSKYFFAGMQASLGIKPKLQPLDKKPEDYDIIFFGTPTWAGRYASPYNTLLSDISLKNKKIALFCTNRGGLKNTFIKMKAALKGNDIMGEIDFIEPMLKDKNAAKEKAEKWAKEIVCKII